MDNQNPQNSPTPAGNRPPPPPPRVPGSGVGAPQQPVTPTITPPATPNTASPPMPTPPAYAPTASPQQGGYGNQGAGYQPQPYAPTAPPSPQAADQQGQYGAYSTPTPPDQPAYPYGQYNQQGPQGQYYSPYQATKSGPPTWIWFAAGGTLLAIIALVVVLVLVLGGNKGTNPVVAATPLPGVIPTTNPNPNPNPNPPQSGGEASPDKAVAVYWSDLLSHNYSAAFDLLTPSVKTQIGSATQLGTIWAQSEDTLKTNNISITNLQTGAPNISGNNATVPLTVTYSNGQTANFTATTQKVGNSWFVENAGT